MPGPETTLCLSILRILAYQKGANTSVGGSRVPYPEGGHDEVLSHDTRLAELLRWRLALAEKEAPPPPRAARLLDAVRADPRRMPRSPAE